MLLFLRFVFLSCLVLLVLLTFVDLLRFIREYPLSNPVALLIMSMISGIEALSILLIPLVEFDPLDLLPFFTTFSKSKISMF